MQMQLRALKRITITCTGKKHCIKSTLLNASTEFRETLSTRFNFCEPLDPCDFSMYFRFPGSLALWLYTLITTAFVTNGIYHNGKTSRGRRLCRSTQKTPLVQALVNTTFMATKLALRPQRPANSGLSNATARLYLLMRAKSPSP